MLLVLFAFLGIPLWFLVGVLAAMFFRKRAIKSTPGSFPCKTRASADLTKLKSQKWGGGVGRWESNVFILVPRFSVAGFSAQAVEGLVPDAVSFPDLGDIKGIDGPAVVLPFRLASGSTIELAVPVSQATAAAGPFTVPDSIVARLDDLGR